MLDDLLVTIAIVAIPMLLVVQILIGVKFMSQTTQLTQAVTELTTAADAVAAAFTNATANTTPDTDVAAAITNIQAATTKLTAITQPTGGGQ